MTTIDNQNSSPATINKHVFTYTDKDVIGTEQITTGTSLDAFTDGLIEYDHNSVNQLTNVTPSQTFTYDEDGNMTLGYSADGYVMTMTYDAENKLVLAEYTDSSSVVHRTEYSYSGDGILAIIKKLEDSSPVSETRFVRSGLLPIQERDSSNAVVREYTWGLNKGGGIGGLLNLKQDGNNYSYLYDGKGNVTAVIDSSQTVVASYRYDEFGNLLKTAGSFEQPYRFSTKQYDKDTGLYAYEYRFYNPVIGVWLTRDPLGEAGGINLYGFVQNNPVNYYDPLGLLAPKWHFGITYVASMFSGYGAWDSAKVALKVVAEDINATDDSASVANIHAMRGEIAPGEYQSVAEAKLGTGNVIQSGSLYSALHAGQDLPGHNYESMEDFGFNWASAKHIGKDNYPGWSIIYRAYKNTIDILNRRDCE